MAASCGECTPGTKDTPLSGAQPCRGQVSIRAQYPLPFWETSDSTTQHPIPPNLVKILQFPLLGTTPPSSHPFIYVGRQVTLSLASQDIESPWPQGLIWAQGPSQVAQIRVNPGTFIN